MFKFKENHTLVLSAEPLVFAASIQARIFDARCPDTWFLTPRSRPLPRKVIVLYSHSTVSLLAKLVKVCVVRRRFLGMARWELTIIEGGERVDFSPDGSSGFWRMRARNTQLTVQERGTTPRGLGLGYSSQPSHKYTRAALSILFYRETSSMRIVLYSHWTVSLLAKLVKVCRVLQEIPLRLETLDHWQRIYWTSDIKTPYS